jgi:CAAX prenyl protease-like protein
MTAPQLKPPIEPQPPSTEGPRPDWLHGPALPRIAPFAAYMAFIAIADMLGRLGWSATELLWLYPVKIAVVVALLIWYWPRYSELRGGRLSAMALLAAFVAGVAVFVLWINLDAQWMQVGVPAGYDPFLREGRLAWLLVACRLAGAALVVPLMEELFWRSFLQRWLAKPEFIDYAPAAVGIRALVIASLLFGVEHNLWFAGVVAGLTYGFLYMRTNNLLSPIVAHATTNGVLGVWILVTGSWTYW